METHADAICFILGVQRRSGTNFLSKLLRLHPDCASPSIVWEDYVLMYSRYLKEYTQGTFAQWPQGEDFENKVGSPEKLNELLGQGIRTFLKIQNPNTKIEQKSPSDRKNFKYLITKTPSTVGIENFFEFFPNDPLIILIRDGRAVVESGVKSFGWEYEEAMRAWSDSARRILLCEKHFKHDRRKYLIVKYENLFNDLEGELKRVFAFLNLDEAKYDFQKAGSVDVIGSSELKRQSSAVHWRPMPKKEVFDPINRFKGWGKMKHQRFNWIAGDAMKAMGYDLQYDLSGSFLTKLRHYICDLGWLCRKHQVSRFLYRGLRKLGLFG